MSNKLDLTIYRSIDVRISRKMQHQKRRFLYKRNKHRGVGFCYDYGDIPVCVIDWLTCKPTEVLNTRGIAYAHRNSLKYHKTKSQKINAANKKTILY